MEYIFYAIVFLILVICLIIWVKRNSLRRINIDGKNLKIGFELDHDIVEAIPNKKQESKEPSKSLRTLVNKFGASVVQVGGEGSRLYTRTVWLEEHEHAYLDPGDYISVWFPSNPELMWVSCREGFQINFCSSDTGNEIYTIESNLESRGLILRDQIKNKITIHCNKIEARIV